MRNYIAEKVYNALHHFNFCGISVVIDDPLPEDIDLKSVLKVVERNEKTKRINMLELHKMDFTHVCSFVPHIRVRKTRQYSD